MLWELGLLWWILFGLAIGAVIYDVREFIRRYWR